MGRLKLLRHLLASVGLLLPLLVISSTSTAGQGTGSIKVEARNNAAITLSVSDGTADFGANLDPLGTKSDSSDTNQVESFLGSGGSYYVWRSGTGNGLTVSVKSNVPWTGTVVASDNVGSSESMTVKSGVLRYSPVLPQDYYGAALSTAFTNHETAFEEAGAKGIHDYRYFYALRVGWDDDPGTFESAVTYSVTH